MTKEDELLALWRAERPMYEAWGEYVKRRISEAVRASFHPEEADHLFKIPVSWRVKAEPSLLAKAFLRQKNYKDPYAEIEDKVGLRIVVLFEKEIEALRTIICGAAEWSATKARDYKAEAETKPFEFDYQSVHFIVRAKTNVQIAQITVSAGTPCEIQVRTILQHAYSELTHDTIYKPKVRAEPAIKRAAAKSMALIEATGDYFSQVRGMIDGAQKKDQALERFLSELYVEKVGRVSEASPINSLLIDAFKEFFDPDALTRFVDEKPFVIERIRERSPHGILYRQDAIFLLYFVIASSPRQAAKLSPLTGQELEPLYGDLGKRMPAVLG